jgi:hypothetical protein
MLHATRVEYPGSIYRVMDRGDRWEDILIIGTAKGAKSEPVSVLTFDTGFVARRCRQDFGGVRAKSGATGRRRPGKTRLNRGQSKASAQLGVGRRGEKLKPEDRGQRTEDRG